MNKWAFKMAYRESAFKTDIRNGRTPQASTPAPNAATQVQSDWIMPDFAFLCITDAWNSLYGFSG